MFAGPVHSDIMIADIDLTGYLLSQLPALKL